MNNCGECKLWVKPGTKGCPVGEFGYCEGIPYNNEDPDPKDIAYYCDYEGYSAGFHTKAEFGCALFEPFEPEPITSAPA